MILKTCSKCKKDLPIKRFVKSNRYIDGHYPICKYCRKETLQRWLVAHTLCSKCKTESHLPNSVYCYRCRRIADTRSPVEPSRRVDKSNKTMCCKCKVNPRSKSGNYCRDCQNEANRDWQRSVGGSWSWANSTPERRKRHLARKYLAIAISRGKMIRERCEVCGDPKTEGHHHKGYEREFWLDVRWLCKKHHDEAERIFKSLLTTQPLLL
jgi:hypothetical protein